MLNRLQQIMSVKLSTVILYTDGACSGNPGPGGWGALLIWNGKEKELSGGERDTTNNRMEMKAVIEGLKKLNRRCRVKVHSDSAYIINAFTRGWIDNWLKRGWKKSNKKPVENIDLWKELIKQAEKHEVEWIKVKGHSDNELNNRVDRIAVEASQKYQ